MLNCLFFSKTKDVDTKAVKSFLLQVLLGEDPISKGEPYKTRDFNRQSFGPKKRVCQVCNRRHARTDNAFIRILGRDRTCVVFECPNKIINSISELYASFG